MRWTKITKWAVGLLMLPPALVLLLVVLLYVPPVQQWAVQRVARYASEQTGLDIRLQRIRVRFPLDMELSHFSATTPTDTLLSVESLVVDLDLGRLTALQIGLEALDLHRGQVNTLDLIPEVVVKGRVGDIHLTTRHPQPDKGGVNLKQQWVRVTALTMDDSAVDVALQDTTVVDTTESGPVMWDIDIRDVALRQTQVTFHTPGDSLRVNAHFRELALKDGDVDLGQGCYKAQYLLFDADTLMVLLAPEVQTELASAVRRDTLTLGGLRLESHDLLIDGQHFQAPQLLLATQRSRVEGSIYFDWTALTPHERGRLDARLEASLARTDVMNALGTLLPADLRQLVPPGPFTLQAQAQGNVDTLHLAPISLWLTPMVEAQASGSLLHVLEPDLLELNLDWDVRTHNLSNVMRWLGVNDRVRMPEMRLRGPVRYHCGLIETDMKLQQGAGTAALSGSYNTKTDAYDARLRLNRLNLHAFLPHDSLYTLTAQAKLNGCGTQVLSAGSRLTAEVDVEQLQYKQWNLDNLHLDGRLHDGNGTLDFSSDNALLKADVCATVQHGDWGLAPQNRGENGSMLSCSVGMDYIDLYALGVTDRPLSLSMVTQLDAQTNLKDMHRAKGTIKAVEVKGDSATFYPSDIDVDVLLAPDSIYADVLSGDLSLQAVSNLGIEPLLDRCSLFYTELTRQVKDHHIYQDSLKALLPQMTLSFKSGRRNTLARVVESLGYTFDRVQMDLTSDPLMGINGDGYVHMLNTGAVMLDTIQWHVFQDSTDVVRLGGRVRNGPRNKQVVFESNVQAELTPSGAQLALDFIDAHRQKGVDLGGQIILEDDGYRLHLHPLNPIIAYRRFTLNEDNYVVLHDDKRLEANIDLLADDGTGLKLYTTPNDDALQDVTLSVHDFNLGELSAVLPYMPQVEGMLAGDFHLIQEEKSMTVLVDAQVRSLLYEGAPLGTVGLNAAYMPNADGTHYVDGIVSQNGSEVMTLTGTYDAAHESIDATAGLQRLPLSLASGFMPDQMLELAGYVTGQLSVNGKLSKPVIDGAITTDSMHLNSQMYSLHLRFPDDTIYVRKGNLALEHIEAYSTGRNPLVLDGNIYLHDLNRIGLNLSLNARQFELINAPKAPHAVAYGKVFVNANARLTGTLNDMMLRGRLNVLGNTNVTYVITDSPLTNEDHLSDLVTFADFSDTTVVETVKQTPQHIDMQVNIAIEEAAQVHCLLGTDGTNYVNLEGGGDLTLSYTSQDGLQLYGRYTIVQGMMNYSLMVVALKNFAIENGSYVDFTGNILNPRLDISAKERIRTTIYENSVPRSVNFDVGLKVTQTLEDMGLEFTIAAPSDMAISNQLATMTAEERGKVAVTMLATGMYITESGNGTSGLSATNALNSFLQAQISQISSKALSTIDVNFGIDNTSSASGATQTDYSFSFAKRFWDNRISLIVGGKVSTGEDAVNTGQSIINNVSIEYRLDKGATRYVRLYYDRDTESLLENDVMEMGAGLVLRRKSTRLGELFLFRKSKPAELQPKEKMADMKKKAETIEKTDTIEKAETHE